MRSIKVYHNGERLRDMYPHATPWQVLKWKIRKFVHAVVRVALIGGVFLAAAAGFGAFVFSSTTTTYATKEVPVQVVVDAPAPVMDRIATCESHNSQMCTEALAKMGMCNAYEVGQVLHHVNKNGTIDTGVMQINSIHGAEAAALGFNLDNEEDNRAYGKYLYANKGTGDWSASQKCWRR